MSQVLVITLDGAGDSRAVTNSGLTVGRGQDNAWVLTDTARPAAMSRRHCRFDIGPLGPTVTDLGSTNGTRVNGQTIVPHRPAPLRGGEVIEIGLRRLSIEVRDTDARLADPMLNPPAGTARGLSVPRPVPPATAVTPMFRDPARREPDDPLGGAAAPTAPVGKPEAGYPAALAATDAGLRDGEASERAIWDGVQSAVDELLALFNPEALEQTLDHTELPANPPQDGRRARLWELYQDRYEEIAKAARSRFMGRLDDAFHNREAAEVAATSPRS